MTSGQLTSGQTNVILSLERRFGGKRYLAGPETIEVAFATIQRRTVTSEAIDQFRMLISSGALAPGQKLPPERVLSDRLGMSRPSVREAIHALATMGVLEKRHGSGTYVTSLSSELLAHPLIFILDVNSEALRELFAVRVLLEVGAVEYVARIIDAAGLQRLSDLLVTLRGSVETPEIFLEADTAFHRVIHEASGNGILLALMDSLSALIKRSRMLTVGRAEVREAALQEHEDIYRALENHDPEAAGKTMREHVEHMGACAERAIADVT